MLDDERIFEASPDLKKFKEEWLKVDTNGILNDTTENSAYIYKLLKEYDAAERLEYLNHLKSHYEGNFPCLMKELIHIDTVIGGEDEISLLKKQLDAGEISLDEYKEYLKELINK
mgnify:CR=1 FL=1